MGIVTEEEQVEERNPPLSFWVHEIGRLVLVTLFFFAAFWWAVTEWGVFGKVLILGLFAIISALRYETRRAEEDIKEQQEQEE